MNNRHPCTRKLLLGLDDRAFKPTAQPVILQSHRDQSKSGQIQENRLELFYAWMPMLH